jgi:hypothetical protein
MKTRRAANYRPIGKAARPPRAPERTEIETGAIRGALSDAFILRSKRHTGTRSGSPARICALFDRDSKANLFCASGR